MPELTKFITTLTKADLLILTRSADRTYCRFFKGGMYLDRMYVTNPALLAELHPLMGEGDEINIEGIAKLKQLFLTSDTQPVVDTL